VEENINLFTGILWQFKEKTILTYSVSALTHHIGMSRLQHKRREGKRMMGVVTSSD
jgi:hypothetical protein